MPHLSFKERLFNFLKRISDHELFSSQINPAMPQFTSFSEIFIKPSQYLNKFHLITKRF